MVRRMRFVVSVKDAKPGDKVFVVGSLPQLGQWKPDCAIELKTEDGLFPKWQVEVELEQTSFQYKYLWKHFSGGHLEWESSADRSCLEGILPEDGEFNHNDSAVECPVKAGSYVYFHGYYAHADWVQQEFAMLKSELRSQAKDLENQGALLEQQAMSSGRQRALIDEQKNLLTALQAELETQKLQTQQLRGQLSDFAGMTEELRQEIRVAVTKAEQRNADRLLRRLEELKADIDKDVAKAEQRNADRLLRRLEELKADIEKDVAKAEQRNGDRLLRELSDFRAMAPVAEELTVEIREALMKDIPSIVTSILEDFRGHDQPGAAFFEEEHQHADGCHECLDAAMPSCQSHQADPAYHASSTKADSDSQLFPLWTGVDKSMKIIPAVAPVSSEDSSSYYPSLKAKPQHDLPVLGETSMVCWETPPQPLEEEAKKLTQEVVNELMSLWKGTKEEKTKLLKTVQRRLHPDKGGHDEAMTWFRDWKDCHEVWYLRGSQLDLPSSTSTQPAG
ncbi:unnamed protein product [Durusdinium trenchii]|uniref:CBM20 domain-containing protein n=2 Tax=Durusdinium trenchii TaxID=1381693 RepID=A0ABP0NYC0_9DINO